MKPTLADLIISGLLKRGILWEVKNLDTEIEIPVRDSNQYIKIIIKAPQGMLIRIEKE